MYKGDKYSLKYTNTHTKSAFNCFTTESYQLLQFVELTWKYVVENNNQKL